MQCRKKPCQVVQSEDVEEEEEEEGVEVHFIVTTLVAMGKLLTDGARTLS